MSSEGAETETSMSVTLPLSESVAALGEQFTAEDNDVDVVDDVSNVVEGVDALPVAQKKKNRRKPHGKKAAKSVPGVDGVVEAVVDKRVVEVDVNELLVSGLARSLHLFEMLWERVCRDDSSFESTSRRLAVDNVLNCNYHCKIQMYHALHFLLNLFSPTLAQPSRGAIAQSVERPKGLSLVQLY